MNRLEAMESLRLGNKLTHPSFSIDEWVSITHNETPWHYIFEDDIEQYADEFWALRRHISWDRGWSIFQDTFTRQCIGRSKR